MISAIILSLQIAAASTLAALPIAVIISRILRGWNSPLKPVVEGFLHAPLVLPPLATGYLLLVLFSPNGPLGGFWSILGLHIPFTRGAAVIAGLVVSFPLMLRSIQLAFSSIDGRLEDVARSLGARELDVFLSVTLPLAWKGIFTGCLLAFARSFGEFGATILFAGNISGETRTVPMAIFHYFNMPSSEHEIFYLMAVSIGVSLAVMVLAHWLYETEKKGRA